MTLQKHLSKPQQHPSSSSWVEQFHGGIHQIALRPPLGRGKPSSWAEEFAQHSNASVLSQPTQVSGSAWAEDFSANHAPGTSWAQEFSGAEVCKRMVQESQQKNVLFQPELRSAVGWWQSSARIEPR